MDARIGYLEWLAEALAERPTEAKDAATHMEFEGWLINLLEDKGLAWRGHSFKNQGWATLLVMKVAREGVPQVGFFTEQTTTGCVRVFLRKLAEGSIPWKRDQFA